MIQSQTMYYSFNFPLFYVILLRIMIFIIISCSYYCCIPSMIWFLLYTYFSGKIFFKITISAWMRREYEKKLIKLLILEIMKNFISEQLRAFSLLNHWHYFNARETKKGINKIIIYLCRQLNTHAVLICIFFFWGIIIIIITKYWIRVRQS